MAQAKVTNIATCDQQIGQYMRYWLQDENFALVQKGQDDYHSLNETEKQKFEYYIEERIRIFSFRLSTGRSSSAPKFQYNMIKEFFKHKGCIEC